MNISHTENVRVLELICLGFYFIYFLCKYYKYYKVMVGHSSSTRRASILTEQFRVKGQSERTTRHISVLLFGSGPKMKVNWSSDPCPPTIYIVNNCVI